MNNVNIIGHLANEPKVKKSKNVNQSVARYALAVNRVLSNDGQEEVDYFNCVAFGVRADFTENFLHEGMMVSITGRLSSGYINEAGKKIYTTEIVVSELEILGGRKSRAAIRGKQERGGQ